MSAFDTAWDLIKMPFYIDPKDDDAGWKASEPYFGIGLRRKNKTTERETSDGKYRTGLNLAHPYYKFKNFSVNPWIRSEQGDIVEANNEQMNEDEMIQRIIDTIVHEEGHHAIEGPLQTDAHAEFMADESPYAYFSNFLPSTQTKERGAMLVEGIPLSEQRDVMRRRGYL
jgi:hypothetical protein